MKSLLLIALIISVVAGQYMYDQDEESRLEAYRRSIILNRLRQLRGNSFRPPLETQDAAAETTLPVAIKNKCDEYGPKGAFDNLLRAVEEFHSCLQRALTFTPKSDYGGIREGVRYACRLAPQLGNCLVELGEAAKPCMPPKRRENFLLANFTHSVVGYACDNDGARVHAFIVGDGPACIRSQAQEVKACAAKFESAEVVNSIENSIESGEVTDLSCKKSAELRKCVEDRLASCPTPAAEEFIRGLLDVAERYSPCNQPEQPERLISVQRTL